MTSDRRGRHRSSQATPRAEGRHTASEERSRAVVVAAAVAVVAVAVGAAAVVIARPWRAASTTKAHAKPPASAATRASAAPAAQEVRVWTGGEHDPLVGRLGSALGASYRVVAAGSSAASDVQLVPVDTTDDPAVVADSPVVLAMPAPMAGAFGPATPQNLQRWFNGTTTWKAKSHPEWGGFRVALPDPATTPTGVIGYAALLAAVNGGPVSGPPDFTHPTAATLAMAHVEQVAVVEPSGSAANALLNATDATSFAKAASAVLTTERAVTAHNAQAGAQRLVGIPLLGGAAGVPIGAVASSNSPKPAVAQAIRALRSGAGQQALQAAGYRTGDQAQASAVAATPPAEPHQSVTRAAINSTRAAWKSAHQLVSTVALLDLSGSMASPFPGTRTPKITLLQQMISVAYQVASPRSRSTVWFFANRPGGPVMGAIPLAANSPSHVGQMIAATRRARPDGGTPVYLAIEKAYDYAVTHYAPGMTNRVLVLSDGANEEAGNPVTLGQVKAYVAHRFDPQRPVTLNMVLINPGPNRTELQQIARLTKGTAVPIRSMADVPKVFAASVFG